MRRLLLLLLVSTTMFFISCEETAKTCEEGCDTWQTCNEESGLCETATGKCANNTECTEDEKICDLTTHECVKPKECAVACKAWETCNGETGVCDLTAGKCADNTTCTDTALPFCDNSHECVAKTSCHFGTLNEETNMCEANLAAITELGATGKIPNQMKLYKNKLYIVNSGDNAIQEFDIESGESNMSFLTMGDGANPWNFAIDTKTADIDEFYVTNLSSNSYYFSNGIIEQTTIFDDPNSLKGPEGITLTTDNIFITNTNLTWEGAISTFGKGFVTVAKKEDNSFIKSLETTQLNPQNIFTIGEKLYVLNTGSSTFDASWINHPDSNAGIDVFDLTDLEAAPTNVVIPFIADKQSAYVASYAISDDETKVYLGSGAAPEIYLYDVDGNKMIRNTDNPIIVDDFGDTLTNSMINLTLVDGHIFAINGNNDTLYIIDKLSLKVVLKQDIGSDANAVEMPQGIVSDDINRKVYIFFGTSKKIISIDIDSL